ncbi:hypothetical protein BT96DRAFT_1009619 [Gymnopus androsaceus JB14]|uniref:Uncharacterized protein n=1 Tax=Gymnopus androsaceus JB14 TaxID=1447944 RepID=A0A6A4GC90_9AGAR|nr:hypothetical protein BT96DRAFT_1009619 [Gymnopus androsaceus JB14]
MLTVLGNSSGFVFGNYSGEEPSENYTPPNYFQPPPQNESSRPKLVLSSESPPTPPPLHELGEHSHYLYGFEITAASVVFYHAHSKGITILETDPRMNALKFRTMQQVCHELGLLVYDTNFAHTRIPSSKSKEDVLSFALARREGVIAPAKIPSVNALKELGKKLGMEGPEWIEVGREMRG